MREALARSDHDFVVSESRPRTSKRRSGTAGFLLGCLRLAYRAAAYPNRVAAALLIVIMIAIMINALALQRSPHPAPLFGRSFSLAPAAAPAPAPVAVPTPPVQDKHEAVAAPAVESEAPKPVRDPINQLLKGANAPVPLPPASLRRHASVEASEAKPAPTRDAITQLLRGNAQQSAAASETKSEPKQEPSKTVLGAQRALVKLGFVLKPDGLSGTATRQALEQFERDHGLPAKGELTPKVIRELSAQSGQAIE